MENFFKIILTLLFSSLLTSSFGQATDQKKQIVQLIFNGFIVKTDILMPLIIPFANKRNYSSTQNYTSHRLYSVTIEKQFKERHSVQVSSVMYMRNAHVHYVAHHRINTSRLRIIPEYKFFVLKDKPITGPYIGIYALAESETNEDIVYESERYYYQNIKLGGGFSTGYQFYIKKRIVVDGLFGVGYKKMVDGQSPYHTNNYSSMDVRLAVNIGYKF